MNFKLITVLLFALVGIMGYANFRQYVENKAIENRNATLQAGADSQTKIITKYVDRYKYPHAVYKNTLAKTDEQKRVATNGYVDSVAAALDVAVKKIVAMERFKLSLGGRVKTEVLIKEGYKGFSYRGKYLTADLSEKDSVLAYNYNVELVNTNYYRGNWLTGKKWYRDIYVADPNATINAVSQFSIPPERTKRVGIGLQVGYGYDFSQNIWKPNLGLGVSYNLIRF